MLDKILTVTLITAMFFIGCFFVVTPAFAVAPPTVTSIFPSSGTTAGGTNVTIGGTGFANGTVTIGGASATNIIVVSANQITATTPAGTAGAQNVVFTRTSDGKSGTLTGGFTYVAPTPDTTAPVITLLGANPVNLYVGDTYSDAGATASDNIDGDITANIITVNPVNTAVAGTYTITYNVSDAANNPATQVTRTVNVSAVTYTLTYTAGANGSITGNSPQTINSGSNGTAVTAVPAAGYHFVNWSDASTANPRTDTNVTGDISVTASFEANPVIPPTQHTLTTSASTGGVISPSSGPYDDGVEAQITATPSAGYSFASWSGDLSGSTNPSTITMNGDKSVTANFEADQTTPAPTPPPSGGGGSVGGTTPITVTFSGQAYPGGAIEVLRKSVQDALFQIIPTESASIKEDGAFEISHTGLIKEEYLYALRIKDKDGRKTTLSFDVNLLVQSSFALKDILAPPTVELKNTLLLRTEDLQLIGYAAPSNTIEVEIDGIAQKGTAFSDKTGYYAFATSVGPFSVGAHYARVRQVAQDGKKSDWSQTKSFKKSLLLALKADFNSDGKVNITDWSVFLFRWGSQDTKSRTTVDLDGNGKVDVIDLSIFLKTIQI